MKTPANTQGGANVSMIFLLAVVLSSFLTMAAGGEEGGKVPSAATASGSLPSPPSFHVIPSEELAEWRINQAEIRVLQAENALAVRERSDKLQALADLWKIRYGIDDMNQWAIDIQNGRIKKKAEEQLK